MKTLINFDGMSYYGPNLNPGDVIITNPGLYIECFNKSVQILNVRKHVVREISPKLIFFFQRICYCIK